ncbi:MAG: PhoH family protein [Burkholderiaceae bacterium]
MPDKLKTPTTTQPLYFVPEPMDNLRLAHLCGPMDENLRQISAALDVTIFRRGEKFIVGGHNADRALAILEQFYTIADKIVSIEEVQLALVEQRAGMAPPEIQTIPIVGRTRGKSAAVLQEMPATPSADEPVLKTRRSDLRGRTPHQLAYIKSIVEHDITFGIGPAGTGKTYLAVACAVDALERDAVKRIILTRPAVEAGERLGFLPGDLSQKIDPYLRPLYDALYDLLGFDRTQKMFEKQAIEIAPLAYMRGRTLNHAFVILDEAQNTTSEQMKMFLTRIGFGSKAVITGDVTQVDLQRSQKSGLVDAVDILSKVRGIAFCPFSSADVVRHPLVARIVDAYADAGADPNMAQLHAVRELVAAAKPTSKANRPASSGTGATRPRAPSTKRMQAAPHKNAVEK